MTVLTRAGRDAEAAALIRQVVAASAATPQGLQGVAGLTATLGRVYQSGRLNGDAARVFKTLLQEKPGDLEALTGLADVLAAGGDIRGARSASIPTPAYFAPMPAPRIRRRRAPKFN